MNRLSSWLTTINCHSYIQCLFSFAAFPCFSKSYAFFLTLSHWMTLKCFSTWFVFSNLLCAEWTPNCSVFHTESPVLEKHILPGKRLPNSLHWTGDSKHVQYRASLIIIFWKKKKKKKNIRSTWHVSRKHVPQVLFKHKVTVDTDFFCGPSFLEGCVYSHYHILYMISGSNCFLKSTTKTLQSQYTKLFFYNINWNAIHYTSLDHRNV